MEMYDISCMGRYRCPKKSKGVDVYSSYRLPAPGEAPTYEPYIFLPYGNIYGGGGPALPDNRAQIQEAVGDLRLRMQGQGASAADARVPRAVSTDTDLSSGDDQPGPSVSAASRASRAARPRVQGPVHAFPPRGGIRNDQPSPIPQSRGRFSLSPAPPGSQQNGGRNSQQRPERVDMRPIAAGMPAVPRPGVSFLPTRIRIVRGRNVAENPRSGFPENGPRTPDPGRNLSILNRGGQRRVARKRSVKRVKKVKRRPKRI